MKNATVASSKEARNANTRRDARSDVGEDNEKERTRPRRAAVEGRELEHRIDPRQCGRHRDNHVGHRHEAMGDNEAGVEADREYDVGQDQRCERHRLSELHAW